jgi:hypothetical protein
MAAVETFVAGAASVTTVVVGVFAGIQLHREHAAGTRRERAAVARLSGIAYLLRQQILEWIGSDDYRGDHFERWIRDNQKGERLNRELNLAVQHAMDMLALIGDSPNRVADGVRRAYVHLLEGSRRVRWYADQHRSVADLYEIPEIRRQARADFRTTAQLLADKVIEPRLLEEEASLAHLRQSDTAEASISEFSREIVEREERESAAQRAVIAPASTSWWDMSRNWLREKLPSRTTGDKRG